MRHIIQHQKEMDHCCICGSPISIGTVPAVCLERCRAKYEYLIELENEEKENADERTA